MFSVEIRVGRLLEIRMESPLSDAEVLEFRNLTSAAVVTANRPIIVCTDLLRARVFSPESAAQITAMMQRDNPLVERNAVLVGESALFSMQIERMLREAGPRSRRTFREAVPLKKWLKEVLTDDELWRLSIFIQEGVRDDRPPSA
jgi:hypothetical protein